MEEVNESETCWDDESGKELVQQPLDDGSPLFVLPKAHADGGTAVKKQPVLNKLISPIYSGPTIQDVESALSMNAPEGRATSRPTALFPQKRFGKMEIKYTVMVKSCGSELAEDGYKWRKYGQKIIKNSPNPRSYYRCTNPRCNAKKQVERSKEDREMLMITYEGLHLHYPYSHFFRRHPQDYSASKIQMPKKPKLHNEVQLDQDHKSQNIQLKLIEQSTMQQQVQPKAEVVLSGESSPESPDQGVEEEALLNSVAGKKSIQDEGLRVDVQRQRGLLEDIVPLLVREPCTGSSTTSNHPYNFSSQTSLPSYSSAFISSPTNSSDLDLGFHFRHSLNLKQAKHK